MQGAAHDWGTRCCSVFSAARLLVAGALLTGALADATGALPLELALAVVAGLELVAAFFLLLLLHAASATAMTATLAAI